MTWSFRVRAHPLDGPDVVYEGFEKRSDAEEYYKKIQSPTDLISHLPYDAIVVSMEELVYGDWCIASVRTVAK
jgi:hypothetical protein